MDGLHCPSCQVGARYGHCKEVYGLHGHDWWCHHDVGKICCADTVGEEDRWFRSQGTNAVLLLWGNYGANGVEVIVTCGPESERSRTWAIKLAVVPTSVDIMTCYSEIVFEAVSTEASSEAV